MSARAEPHAIRVLALMEATSVTGPAKNLLEFARCASAAGDGLPAVEMCVVTYHRGDRDQSTPFRDAVTAAGLPMEIVDERRRLDPDALAQLRAIVARRRPDVIQTHNVKSHLLVRLGGFRRTIPWIAFHHGYTRRDWLDRVYNQCNRFSLPGADHVVTVCRPFAARIQRYGVPASRISVRHNIVRPFVPPAGGAVAQVRARFGLPEGIPVILAAGRLSREKGHADLVEAVSRLRRRDPALEFRVAVAGEGPERAALEARLSALGLADRVILCGHHADLAPFYAFASVVALLSHSEGSPNVLLEAMAAGVPAVATRAGGIPEIAVDGETALLVDVGDTGAAAGALARLLREPELARRLAGCAQAAALENYTPDSYRRSIVALYQNLLAARSPAGRTP